MDRYEQIVYKGHHIDIHYDESLEKEFDEYFNSRSLSYQSINYK